MTSLSFRGISPDIADSAWIAPSAVMIGNVRMGESSSAFWGVVVRADGAEITIGAATNLQENVVVHADRGRPAIIGSRVSVGHAAVLHGCVINSDVLVGMSATVLNGAVIGEGSLIAAGAVIREGMRVPAGSLVAGVPAVVRRGLTAQERARIITNAEHYQSLAGAYATALG